MVLFPLTMSLTTSNASLKSSNKTCLIPSLLQYAARSLSPPGLDLTKSKSACLAADMSDVPVNDVEEE